MKRTIYILPILILITLLASCGGGNDEREFHLPGVWKLVEVRDYNDNVYEYPRNNETWMRIYDDTCYYMCQWAMAPTGTLISPIGMENYTFMKKGPDDVLYLQGENTHPLTIEDDSTMVIQETVADTSGESATTSTRKESTILSILFNMTWPTMRSRSTAMSSPRPRRS